MTASQEKDSPVDSHTWYFATLKFIIAVQEVEVLFDLNQIILGT
jgi:hypothetical protein